LEKSLKIIKDGVGTHFDKKIAQAFEEIHEKIYYNISNISSKELEKIFSYIM